MVDEYSSALVVDIMVVVTCTFSLVRWGDLRFSHPATPYILFHVHTVTSRLAGIMNGAYVLYAKNSLYREEIVPAEIVRAVRYCDIAFCAVTAVWILFALRSKYVEKPPASRLMLQPRLLRPILLITFIGGIVGLRLSATIPGIEAFEGINPESSWSSSSYLYILPGWFGLAVMGYAYYYGFGKISMSLVVLYLALMAVQGSFRFRAIIGLLMTVQILMEHRNRRWPTRTTVVGLAIAGVLFFPMKQIAYQIQRGEDFGKVIDAVSESMTALSEGAAADQMFLDEFACALTLLDIQGKKYMGSIFIPLLTLPIPRALWPDKPVLAGFLMDISTQTRPMYMSGMITTYLGESYANFGLAGIFLVPPAVALLLALFHRRARASAHHSVLSFSYVLLSVNLLQVYRDGLQSVVVFVFVNMMPLTAIVVAHIVQAMMGRRARLTSRVRLESVPVEQEPSPPVTNPAS